MRYLFVLTALFGFLLPLSAADLHWSDLPAPLSWSDLQTGCNCANGGPCTCGVNCDCAACGWRTAYYNAIEQHKPLVVGVGVSPPVSIGWTSAMVSEGVVPNLTKGTVAVMVPKGQFLYITKRITGQVDPFDVAQAVKVDPLAQPVLQTYGQPTYYSTASGCGGGATGFNYAPVSSYGTSVGSGLRMLMGFGGFRGACGPGG